MIRQSKRVSRAAGLWLFLSIVSSCTQAEVLPQRAGIAPLESGIPESMVEKRPYASYVAECAKVLMKHGTDRYGPKKLPILVAILDVRSRQCPVDPPRTLKIPSPYRNMQYGPPKYTQREYPLVTAVPWRGENRDCYWKPRGSDFFEDQTLLDVYYILARMKADPRYARFADRYLRTAMNMGDAKGFFWWGSHRYYDVYEDKSSAPNGDVHEILIGRPRWEQMWRVDPDATRKEIEAIWKWHIVDKQTGLHNRHGDGRKGFDFTISGGEFILAFSFLYTRTHEPMWLKAAELVADHHWNSREPRTNMIPSAGYLPNRFDSNHFGLDTTGIFTYDLLKSYELTGLGKFRDQALVYLRAYAKYGYDRQTGKFWGSIRLDGVPSLDTRLQDDYKCWQPSGYTDLWQPYHLGWEHPIHTAKAYAYAYQLTGDSAMLNTAEKWASYIRENPPSSGCRTDTLYEFYARLFSRYGTFAGLYGQSISFFVHMYALTGQTLYLEDARRLAREAVSKLYYKGLFRGHPARPYYSSVDGVGSLMFALLQLDRAMAFRGPVKGLKGIPLAKSTQEAIGFDNW